MIPDLMETGGRSILDLALELGSEARLGECTIVEADMDALALIDEAKRLGAERIVLLGPRHREDRGPGVYLREEQPRGQAPMDPNRIVRELWGNLTGSLRLDDYVAAMKILYPGRFYVAECEPGPGGDCRNEARRWLQQFCGEKA